MATAICPGSFDPVTMGHLDIITRTAHMFDHIIVLVVNNYAKTSLFTAEERMALLNRVISLPNVEITTHHGLVADYARTRGARVLIKGLRAVSDFEYEFQMAMINRKLNPDLETVFLTAQSDFMYLSSSVVKQVAAFGGSIVGFVPDCIINDVQERLYEGGGNA